MKDVPKISVIVPVYKVEPYLQRCVDSILKQSFTDFELILVDDGSPDNCGAICDEYAAKDARVHVIHQGNSGVAVARNAGIDWAFTNSDSQWIAFIDSDDWIHPRYLEILYNNATEYNVRISACRLQGIQDGEVEEKMNEAPPICIDAETACADYYGVMVLSFLKLYDKALFENIRFPIGKVYGEDTFITHQLLFLCDHITISPSVLYYYFQHSQSVVHSSWKPGHLDDIEAHEHRIQYLKGNGYQKAYDAEKRIYIGRLRHHIEKIRQSEWKGSKYEKLLRNKLRLALIRYRNVVSFAENKWIYESAYPRLMNIYWIATAKWNKLKSMCRISNEK